jgi:predicted kinase
MTQRILVMGLPGAGKTYLAQHIVDHLQADKKRSRTHPSKFAYA